MQCCGQNPTVGELEKIVGSADKSPLGAHLFEAAQQELAESARLFDLSEHRLGQLLAQPVGLACPPALIFARIASTRVGSPAGSGESCAAVVSPVTVPATASLARPVAT